MLKYSESNLTRKRDLEVAYLEAMKEKRRRAAAAKKKEVGTTSATATKVGDHRQENGKVLEN